MKNNVKIIFHIDLNAFFISCELISSPELIGKAIAVGGKGAVFNKGVLTTASYEARKYGVHSAMPVYEARKLCPHLIILTGNMSLYQEYSQKFREFLAKYTQLIEFASIDEAYLDVTKRCETIHPLKLAEEIRDELYETLKLPSSIGIAANKFLAKMASDMKKPMGITVLRKRDIDKLLWGLPIEEMFGIGKKTAPKLRVAGINTIGDLADKNNASRAMPILGNQYEHFYLNANGFGSTDVNPERNSEYKSIGNSNTYNEVVYHETVAYQKLKELCAQVHTRLLKHHYAAKTVTVQIRNTRFETHSKSLTLKNHTQNETEIYQTVINLFDELWDKGPIRLLGVSLGHLSETGDTRVPDLFNYETHMEDEKVIKLINEINRRFGEGMIRKGGNKR